MHPRTHVEVARWPPPARHRVPAATSMPSQMEIIYMRVFILVRTKYIICKIIFSLVLVGDVVVSVRFARKFSSLLYFSVGVGCRLVRLCV